jgi:hypothetical protein
MKRRRRRELYGTPLLCHRLNYSSHCYDLALRKVPSCSRLGPLAAESSECIRNWFTSGPWILTNIVSWMWTTKKVLLLLLLPRQVLAHVGLGVDPTRIRKSGPSVLYCSDPRLLPERS